MGLLVLFLLGQPIRVKCSKDLFKNNIRYGLPRSKTFRGNPLEVASRTLEPFFKI